MKEYILNQNQKKFLRRVDFLRNYSFYLAGGTALALQLGHRTSKDLDFYTLKTFRAPEVARQFQELFTGEVSMVRSAPDTLWLKVKFSDLSFFRYPYKLIRPVVPYFSVDLASPEDIAAMKMEAIIGRGKKRDFVDIYYLIKKYGLRKFLKFFREKYPEVFNEQNCLHALMYFKDAEAFQKDRRKIYLYENIEWKDIKKYIENEVKNYQLNSIKKEHAK